jgi:serine/threonine-protein kinase RsbW
VAGSNSDDLFREDAVRLSVPTSLEYVRIVRLNASGVATRLGFDVDEIENLRVAVDELASMVVDAATPGRLDVEFSTNGSELRIEGAAPVAPGTEVGIDDLSAQILKAVCDDYDLRVIDGVARFRCVRRYPA